MNFNEKIIQARKTKALTQEDLAEAVGVSRQAVSKWETGEAKPDLDKLIALSKVLDLSMDYLCLDKQPEVTVELPQPTKPKHGRFFVAGIAMGLVVAMLVGVVWVSRREDPDAQTSTQPSESTASTVPSATAPDYAYILGALQVADSRLVKLNNDYIQITFNPSIQVEGMQVQIAMRNNKVGKTYYFDATQKGGEYSVDFTLPDYAFNYDFIAICSVGDVTVQFPLIHAEGDSGKLVFYDYIWKNQ